MTVSRDVFGKGYERLDREEYHELIEFVALAVLEADEVEKAANR